MLLRLSLGRADAAAAVEAAVTATLAAGYRTGDLAGAGERDRLSVVGTTAFADAVVAALVSGAAEGVPA
jgi:3-isopropylmalate dehydrogenase